MKQNILLYFSTVTIYSRKIQALLIGEGLLLACYHIFLLILELINIPLLGVQLRPIHAESKTRPTHYYREARFCWHDAQARSRTQHTKRGRMCPCLRAQTKKKNEVQSSRECESMCVCDEFVSQCIARRGTCGPRS